VNGDAGGSTTGLPGVAFGFIDPLAAKGARIGLDDILVVTAP